MFSGGHTNNMDIKGRVNVPAPFRDVLRHQYGDARMMITLDIFDNCLRAYPLQEWEAFLEKLRQQPSTNRTVRRITRRVVGSAFECEPDKQGRVLLAPTLRDHASLQKTVHFSGHNNTFEIWSHELWQKETGQFDEPFDEGLLAELGI
ncbi:MAG: division/cell wall cluster transcriptional repressor MraZ [Zetaproteobacteria bacterium CG_4_9_14_3_um_filter_49_83]|nr:MAG: division/cell wall cluster transcriptional repressor MraZ [Zetaproteobacteria bacterium CG1_02_49_23]PIQ34437.1 MAG: division/cell wall cluster transcriptional repressor MraZ [Zetaproteobacteria bacterium CG17_big_fil_post_rev_8_21_14_2_50_50_13]PIV29046.1 MAG: division/cell wall cluster transcriptional repressor MraZ [Zetaproteobacteria bacterium CG02_land_8_20_14_3_00_50_9]PIY56420.1 MAG: division/cell wall cluster transcriptional repressor MraZ [Zetaproteobacteria bacterium CG_4_10_14